MSLRANARYAFGLDFVRFMPLNDDKTIPIAQTVDGAYSAPVIIGGAGPFDFSGASAIAAVPFTVQVDGDAEANLTIDLTAAVDDEAVTVDELVTALNAVGVLPTVGLTASKALTPVSQAGRLKIVITAPAAEQFVQFYGEAAELAMIGQGFGLKWLNSNTMQSLGDTPTMKDAETFTTTDAHGIDTEVISDEYRKGFTGTIVDTAEDWEILNMMEGGILSADGNYFEVPTINSSKPYFLIEAYYGLYSQGTNKEADIVGYVKKVHRTCKGMGGDRTHERGFANASYSLTGTSYKDASGRVFGDTTKEKLTVAAYNALNLQG